MFNNKNHKYLLINNGTFHDKAPNPDKRKIPTMLRKKKHAWLLVNIYFQFSQFPPVAFLEPEHYNILFRSVMFVYVHTYNKMYSNKFIFFFALFSFSFSMLCVCVYRVDWLVKIFN